MKAEAALKGCELVARPVPLDDQGQPRGEVLAEMVAAVAADGIGLLYLGPDSFIAAHRKTVTETALAHQLPTFSATEVALREGKALFGLVSGYEALGRLTAHKAAQILFHGVRPAAIPIETLSSFSYLVNMDVARQLQLTPPPSVLQHAEVIR
jgi:putative ABC transport system substrate-binding protein